MNIKEVLQFWFDELEPKEWWVKDSDLDQLISNRFRDLHKAANRGELWSWRQTPEGRLAEVIVLDQFSRNIFRDKPESFASDPMALVLAQEAVSLKVDEALNFQQRAFLYMPYMHSESLLIHEQAVKLFSVEGMEFNYDFELKHKAIIERFGRYPHRNKILSRQSRPEELSFLSQPDSSF